MSGASTLSFSVERVPLKGWSSLSLAVRRGVGSVTMPQHSASARVGAFLYIGGHYGLQHDENRKACSVLGVLNLQLRMWEWIPFNGYFGQGSKMFLLEDSLFCFGPRDFRSQRSGSLSRFDLALKEWSLYETVGEKPGTRSYFSGDFLETLNRYVVFGGYGRSNQNEVYILDMPTRRWFKAVARGTPPSGRFQHGSCVHKGVVYMFGGWGNGARHRDELYLLKVGRGQTVSWSSPRTNALEFGPRSSFAFISFGRVLLLCGGFNDAGFAGLAFYDPDLGEFNEADMGPVANHSLGSGAVATHFTDGRSIAVLGGLSKVDHFMRISIEQ